MLRLPVHRTTRPIVVSFPKSGRTWLRAMLYELGIAASLTHAGSSDLEHRTFNQIPPPDARLHGRKVIFMHRDPRDTVVSEYIQATRRLIHFFGSLSDFIRDPRYGIEKCVRFNTMWLAASTGRDNVCVVSYESLHRNTTSEMRRVLAFLGATVADTPITGGLARKAAAPTPGDHRRCYDDPTRRIVEERHRREIDHFGWTF